MSDPDSPTPPELPTSGSSSVPPELPIVVDEEALKTKRSKRSFWQKLGGEGLVVSMIIHGALIVIALFWVISTWTDSAKKEPDSFATGAGGGAAGERAKQFKTRLQPKNPKSTAKTPNRITSKSTSATIALPDLPTTSMASLNTGLMGGGQSKGFGGGSGGGIGSGMGVGRGNGKNFVSIYGSKMALNGMVGVFYDFKQDRAGKPTDMMGPKPEVFGPVNAEAVRIFSERMEQYVQKGFLDSSLSNVFRAPDSLYASQIFIPPIPATEAPKAFDVADKCRPSRWMAHYKGTLKAPRDGKFRFVGMGDDFLIVRWDRKVALDSGYQQFYVGNENVYKDFGKQKCNDVHPSTLGKPMRCGPWITVTRDKEYYCEVIMGETPGGVSCAILCMETTGPDGKADGQLRLFRMNNDPLPDAIKNGCPQVPNVDMANESWTFKSVKTSAAR